MKLKCFFSKVLGLVTFIINHFFPYRMCILDDVYFRKYEEQSKNKEWLLRGTV